MRDKDKKIISPLIPNQQLYHDICWYFYTYIAQAVKAFGSRKEYFVENIEFKNDDEKNSFILASKEENFIVWKWLIDNGHQNSVYNNQSKHIVCGLVDDFCSFIASALHCIEKNQLTPAISLLRKPLTDNLAYLEMLILDSSKKIILDNFQSGKSSKVSGEIIKEIICKITEVQRKNDVPFVAYDAQAIWNMRYYMDDNLSKFQDSNCAETGFSGLPTLFNKAIHLYTEQKGIATPSININMIFDVNFENYRKYCLRQIYSTLPILLYHTANIVNYLYDIPPKQHNSTYNEAYSREQWSNYIAIQTWIKHVSKEEDDMLWINIEDGNTFLCKKCNSEFEYYDYNKKELENLFYGRCYKFKPIALCKKCNTWFRRYIDIIF